MKPCLHCKAVKELAEFHRHPQMADGHINVCKSCRNSYVKRWDAANHQRRKNIANRYARKTYTPEKAAASWAKWYGKADKARMNSRQAARRSAELRATPEWANHFFIEEAYDIARKRTEVTGIEWHVDHMVPLQSDLVCGLRVESNLRVIPASINRGKRNRYWPDMPVQRIN